MKFDHKVKEIVQSRDRGICQWSGRHLGENEGDVHHRRARGRGGSEAAWINSPANLVLLSRESHRYIEEHPDDARARGFRLDAGQHPALTPVIDYVGDVLYYDETGGVHPDSRTTPPR